MWICQILLRKLIVIYSSLEPDLLSNDNTRPENTQVEILEIVDGKT